MNGLLKKVGVSAAALVLAASSTAIAVSAEEVTVNDTHMKNGHIDVFVDGTLMFLWMAHTQLQGLQCQIHRVIIFCLTALQDFFRLLTVS